MKRSILFFITLISLNSYGKDRLITEFGAIPDNKTINTLSIQNTIDAVHASGGGKVIIPNGSFVTGTIFLKDNITLYFMEGAILYGSTNMEDYPVIYPKFKSFTDSHCNRSIIYAENCKNIAIEGKGLIDGNGGHPTFSTNIKDNDDARPFGIRIISCSNITVRDIEMRNAAQWMQHYLDCDFLFIEGIKVTNHVNRNNDGLDIDGCRNVTVSNCIIDADDDALCLKANGPADCENVTITNCVLKSNCNAFKMGTETTGGFKNIVASNLVISASSKESPIWKRQLNLSGITILSMDGGKTENVSINNVIINGVYAPIFIKLGNRLRKYADGASTPEPGYIKNIRISEVIAHDSRFETSHISGFPGHYVENITLENIEFFCYGDGKKEDILEEVEERETSYPDVQLYDTWYPSYGLFARHVKGLHLNNVKFNYNKKDERPAIFADDVEDLNLFNVQSQSNKEMEQVYYLKDVKNASFRNCVNSELSNKFVNKAGNSKNIIINE
jgi:hypothetical protein